MIGLGRELCYAMVCIVQLYDVIRGFVVTQSWRYPSSYWYGPIKAQVCVFFCQPADRHRSISRRPVTKLTLLQLSHFANHPLQVKQPRPVCFFSTEVFFDGQFFFLDGSGSILLLPPYCFGGPSLKHNGGGSKAHPEQGPARSMMEVQARPSLKNDEGRSNAPTKA